MPKKTIVELIRERELHGMKYKNNNKEIVSYAESKYNNFRIQQDEERQQQYLRELAREADEFNEKRRRLLREQQFQNAVFEQPRNHRGQWYM
jgi:ribonuclease D